MKTRKGKTILFEPVPRGIALGVALLTIVACGGCILRPEEKAREWARRAETAWAQQRFTKAISLWEKARTLSPEDTALALRLACAYGHRFHWDEALALCQEVLDRHPRHDAAWRAMAFLAMAAGRMGEAFRAVETLRWLDPDGAESLSLRGDFLLLQGDTRGALQTYEEALAALASEETQAKSPSQPSICAQTSGRTLGAVLQAKKAACLLVLGRRSEALRLVENLSAMASTEPDVWAHAGRIWELLGEGDQAARAYEAAFTHNPGDISPMVRRIRLAISKDRPQEAAAALDRLEKSGAPAAVVGKLRVEGALHQGRLEDASKALTVLSAKGLMDTEGRLLEAKMRLLEDRPVAALILLEKILDLEPHIPTAHYLAGLAHLRSNHVRLAQKSMIRALELDPALTEARVILAATYYKLGEAEPARAHAQALAEREPENPDARILLALAAAEAGAVVEASRHGEALKRLDGDFRKTLLLDTLLWAQAGDPGRALESALHWWETHPEDADAAWCSIRLACETRRAEEVRRSLERTRSQGLPSAVFQILIGDFWLCTGRAEEARTAYVEALKRDAGMASAYRGLAQSEEATKESRAKILMDFQNHVSHSPEPIAALADLSYQTGDTAAARTFLEKGLAAHPESGVLLNNLAWLYLESNVNLDKALTLAQRAYDLLPHRVEVLDTLGYAYLKKGLTARALWYLCEARTRAPENPMAAYHLGLAYAAQGDADQARLHLEAALHLGLPETAAVQAKALIQNQSRP